MEMMETKKKITTSIIVPAYNEEEGLPIVLEKIFASTNGVHEVLVVDDGSADATAEVASRFPCQVIKHEVNKGKGEAIKTGLRYAIGETVIFIDSDDTYPADVIPQMTEYLKSYDVVYGSRTYGRENIPLFNQFGNWMFQSMMRYIYGFKANDYSTGLYGIKKRYLEEMDICSTGFSIEPEIAIKASRMKLQVKDIPIEYGTRVGETKLHSFQAGFDHMKTILGHVFWRPCYKNACASQDKAYTS
ncbi:MAG: glycosyltransferase family 2 protein [Planctomycetes bacterium]|nr:glycosyltransferase family 2 protein [Planctomycetota bacterium]